MSIKRVTAPGASFVCSVVKTRWPGERCLDRDLRRLEVASFTDHDAVGILPQERPQHARERETDRFVHRHLHDAFEVVLDRLLSREQLRVDRVDLAQAGVKRRRFPEPVGPVTMKMPLGG
jgi:hypothetical protein